MLFTLLFVLAAAVAAAEPATVTASSANVRAGAGTTHAVVATLPRGARVEILETSGEWHRVRSQDGKVQGWLSARLLQRIAAPAPPAAAAAPAAPQAEAALPGRMSIEHREVSCLIAEEFAKVEACVSPADAVARTQVHFRASDSSPWFSVDMRPEGSCLSAILPKPKKTTKQVQYFIYALDRRFAESSQPEGAPGTSFEPRVVAAKGQCAAGGMLGSVAAGAREIVVSVARTPGGKLVQGAASALGSPAEVAGFSAQGIVPGQAGVGAGGGGAGTGAAAAGAAGAAGVGATAAGGVPVLLVAGGAVGAGAIVAVAAGGSGGEEEESASLTGSWSGTVGSGRGLTTNVTVPEGSCAIRQDLGATLTQNGSSLTGPASATIRSFTCSIADIQPFVASIIGQVGTGQLNATLSGSNAIAIDFGGGLVLRGTYSSTTIDATGRLTDLAEGAAVDYILSITKGSGGTATPGR